jgi:hypothetical protein
MIDPRKLQRRQRRKAKKLKRKAAAVTPAVTATTSVTAPTMPTTTATTADIQAAAHRLAAFLASQLRARALWRIRVCAANRGSLEREATAAGAEWLTVVFPSPESLCCGKDVIVISTVGLCRDPTCQQDHETTPQRLAEATALAATRGTADPRSVRTSRGWAAVAGMLATKASS